MSKYKDLVDVFEQEDFGYDEDSLFELRDRVIELQDKIRYARDFLSNHLDDETIMEAFGD